MSKPEQGMAGDGVGLTLTTESPNRASRHSMLLRFAFTACMGIIFAGFISLGTWQVKRLQWKLDLIERVEQRVHAAATPAPTSAQWPSINASADEYRHVQVTGNFLAKKNTLVQASTELGSGFWVLTPFRTMDQSIVLINRGFIPEQMAESYRTLSQKDHSDLTSPSTINVSGLMRMTEPGGGFLRKNDPAGNRWYSRDAQAIAAANGLTKVAPFFIDADAGTNAPNMSSQDKLNTQRDEDSSNYPVAGLTVINFHNNHLVYAVVWFLLAIMTGAAWLYVIRDKKYQPRQYMP